MEAAFQPARENLAKINQAKDYAHLRNSLHLTEIRKEDLRLELAGSKVHVIEIVPNSLVTNRLVEEAETVEGEFIPSTERDQLKLMVMERHRRTGHIGLGIVKGFKLKRGAIASTVAHDCCGMQG
jgi:adenine deaminase